jgi:hypothetical protein
MRDSITVRSQGASGRSLHLIDVENLLGGTSFSVIDVTLLAAAYGPVASVGPNDFVIISSSHYTAPATWFGWGRARRVVRSGPNGADLALIDVIETENVATRFARIVIGSGDKIFAESAAQLQTHGVHLTVVSRPESLSHQLRLAARDIRYLELMPELGPAALRKLA